MTLAASRIVVQGETPYAHERAAIDFAIQALPNNDPYHLWALLELLDPTTGRLYEIDLLVLGYSALYLIEVKSGPGRYTGDYQDWYRTPPGEDRPRYLENPLRLTNQKAKVLASRIARKLKDPKHKPWVQPLTFLSAEDLTLAFNKSGDHTVVTRDSLLQAVQHHQFPGSPDDWRARRINEPQIRDIAQAIKAIGLEPRKGQAHVGSYALGSVLDEGPGYQDRTAVHRDQPAFTRRARIYLVPQQSEVERRQQLIRAADREAQLLWDVREHPNILSVTEYVTDAPLGRTVLFESFDEGVPLGTFLRQNPDLDFYSRVQVVEQVGRALAYCHKKEVVHGALSPEAVLVRRGDRGLEIRLFNFMLGSNADIEATTHWTALANEPWAIYQAPELREDPSARSPVSDLFSLGALAYLVFTGQSPGENFVEIDRRLARDHHLDPLATTDGMHEALAELIRNATALSPVNRWNDAEEWVEYLLAEITKPEPTEKPPELDPLDAKKNDVLGGDFRVEGVLGQGATSRVLEVTRLSDERKFALKVARSPEHDDRLADEAVTLERLKNHSRIVQSEGLHTVGGRQCLLLTVAGSQTLHRYLAQEGTVSLDLAARYGDDLLSALQHLEEEGIQHRDVKPANLGVGTVSRGANHLTLFDFSLSSAPATELQIGTAAYRDPYLRLRGTWDGAAERWSAAVTLHEMLTGVRPTFGEPGNSPLAEDAVVHLAAERFDPSVRDVLITFFERAFAREVEARFVSAEEMRRAWIAAFEVPQRAGPPDADPTGDTADLDDTEVAAIRPDTLIESLPLSIRARNALDRAGLTRARDLATLADNRLSAIRGIGALVAKEIVKFKNRWQALQEGVEADAKPFFSGYRGEDIFVHTADVEPAAATALRDAGLKTLAAVAAAPAEQIEALATKNGFDPKKLEALLAHENEQAGEREHPSTLEGWVEALLPKRSRKMKHPRHLFGVDGDFAGRLDVTVKELADHDGVTPAAVYIALGKVRDEWLKHGALPELRRELDGVLDAEGGAVPLRRAAEHLLAKLPHDSARPKVQLHAEAGALFRVVAEAAKDADAGLQYVRLGKKRPWVFASSEHVRVVKALGEAADQLAQRSVLAGPVETARVLGEIVRDTPLAQVSPQRLAEMAAEASDDAACSTRLEIYPRKMPGERALSLSSALLRSGVTPDEVIRRVSLRYPEAQNLPTRPELDALLSSLGLSWSPESGKYTRPGEEDSATNLTRGSTINRAQTAHHSQARAMDPSAIEARQFDQQLRNAVERRQFRVLGVRTDRARDAALELAKKLEVEPTPFDRKFIEAVRKLVANAGLEGNVVHEIDAEGQRSDDWRSFLNLARDAAKTVADELLPAKKPLLIVQPGLIARYELTDFLTRLLETSKDAECAAIFLLVPERSETGIPRINGQLSIPGVLKSQATWVSKEWLENRHNAAA